MSIEQLDTILKFQPSLPCCTTDGEKLCGKPAFGGVVWFQSGHYILQPICRDCILATAKLYRVITVDESLKPEKEQSQDEQPG